MATATTQRSPGSDSSDETTYSSKFRDERGSLIYWKCPEPTMAEKLDRAYENGSKLFKLYLLCDKSLNGMTVSQREKLPNLINEARPNGRKCGECHQPAAIGDMKRCKPCTEAAFRLPSVGK